jgi:hypothetical protein
MKKLAALPKGFEKETISFDKVNGRRKLCF